MPPPKPALPPSKVPPDGGWGWVVAGAFALNNIINIPILQNFGLLFKDIFQDLQISATDTTVIMNVNNAFGLALGLMNGPLLRRFGYRKIATVGSLLVFLGIALTSTANSFWQFLLFYGIITSAGSGLGMASFSFAINSYFKKKRGMAMGFAMTVTGLGPIFMPHLMSYFMTVFGVRGTALLLAGLSLHSLVGACLLQPIKWHAVTPEPEEPEEKDKKDEEEAENEKNAESKESEMKNGTCKKEVVLRRKSLKDDKRIVRNPEVLAPMLEDKEEEEEEREERANKLTPLPDRRRVSTLSTSSQMSTRLEVLLSRTISEEHQERGPEFWASVGSMHSIDLGGSALRLDCVGLDRRPSKALESPPISRVANGKASEGEHEPLNPAVPETNGDGKPPAPQDAVKAKKKPLIRRWMLAVVRFFDLNLLSDPIYVNLMLGMSLAVFAEINFSLLTPFILQDRSFTTPQIATMMSLIASADIVFRFLAPFIGRAFKTNSRVMYMFGLILLIGTRTVLIFADDYTMVMVVMVMLGMAKGVRTVFWVLVIPDYVPIERLPAASGIQSITNAVIFMSLGPALGLIRDQTGNYNYCIMTINLLTLVTITMWCTEFLIVAVKKRRRAREGASLEKCKA